MKKILRFTASWCQPCKMLSKNLEELKTDIPIEVVDIDVNPEMAVENRVRSVPTLLMMEDGVEKKRLVGLVDKNNLLKWIEV